MQSLATKGTSATNRLSRQMEIPCLVPLTAARYGLLSTPNSGSAICVRFDDNAAEQYLATRQEAATQMIEQGQVLDFPQCYSKMNSMWY